MYCPKCGKELSDKDTFCPSCGTKLGAKNEATPSGQYNKGLESPPKLVPFILGLFLGIIGVVIAILIYNGKDDQYSGNPVTSALIWSIFGMLFIFIVVMIIVVIALAAGITSSETTEIISLFF